MNFSSVEIALANKLVTNHKKKQIKEILLFICIISLSIHAAYTSNVLTIVKLEQQNRTPAIKAYHEIAQKNNNSAPTHCK